MSTFFQSIAYARSGLKIAFRHHPNIQRQLLIGCGAIVLGAYVHLSLIEWIVLVLTMTIVFLAEFMNTLVEEVVNLITTEYHKQARIAKDVAAGMVLLASFASAIIGALLFLQKILR